MRSRPNGHETAFPDTNDAGVLLRFTATYAQVIGGQLSLAMDPPTVEPSAKEGRILVQNFSIKGEAALDRVAAGGPNGAPNGISFTGMLADFVWQNGQLTVREGVLKGTLGGGSREGRIAC